ERQRVRGQRKQQNRVIGGIDFAIRRRRRHARRQIARRARDHRLHVLRRRVNVAVQGGLQRNLRAAEGAGRAHGIEAGNGGKILFQRRCHRGRHGLGAGSRQIGADRDRREIDRRQIAHRQRFVAEDAEDENADHHQGGRDRPADKKSGDIHDAPCSAALALPRSARCFRPSPDFSSLPSPAACLISLREPGPSRNCPSRVTVSPGASPLVITDWPSWLWPTVTRRTSTVLFSFTTKTCWPSGPIWIASEGTTTTSDAIQIGPEGQQVFVVKENKTVDVRRVTVGQSQEGESVITKGLAPGETVVREGQFLLGPGSRVEIKQAAGEGAEEKSGEGRKQRAERGKAKAAEQGAS